MDGSEPALGSPGSSMVARLMCDAGATEGASSDGAENSSSDGHDAQFASDSGASELAAAGGGASELAAAGGSTPEAAAAAASPEAAAAFGTSYRHDATFASDSGGASGRAAPEAAAAEAAVPEAAVPEAAVPEAAVPEAAVPEAAVPKAAAAEVAVPQSPLQIREVDVAEFARLFSGTAAFDAPPVACKKPLVLGEGSEGRVIMVRRRSTDSPMAFKEWGCHVREGLKMTDLFSVRTATVGPPPLTARVGASG